MNTVLRYMYRDASNYKTAGEAVFCGEITEAEREGFARACDEREYFIASQIGLTDLQPRMHSFPDGDDHPWSELEGFELTEASPTHGSIHDLVRSMGGIEWDVIAACIRLGISVVTF